MLRDLDISRHNGRVKWGAVFGWGVAIYAVNFLTWSILVIYGIIDGPLPAIVLTATLVTTLTLARRSLSYRDWRDVLPYTIGWLFIVFIFDLICAVPVSGWGIWNDWHIWVGYALIIAVPLVVSAPPRRRGRS